MSGKILNKTIEEVLTAAPAIVVGMPRDSHTISKIETCCAIDPVAMFGTPSREFVRVNIDPFHDSSLRQIETLRFLGSMRKLLPTQREIVAIFEHRSEGIIIFLPTTMEHQ